MANFGLGYYSSAYNVALTLNTSTNVNIYDFIIANSGWRNTSKKLRAVITIPAGQTIYSTNPLLPALTIPANGATSFRSYDFILIVNNGTIAGAGGIAGLPGAARNANGNGGGAGGTAIRALRNFYVNNQGNIYGGGGGGGGGGGNTKKCYRTRVNRCAAFTGCGGTPCYISGTTDCGRFAPDPGPYCTVFGGAININSGCGSARQYQQNAGNCSVASTKINGDACTITYNYADCLTDEVTCDPPFAGNNADSGAKPGATGGVGKGYLAGGINETNINGVLSVNPGTGAGGNGGNWGQPGDNGVDGLTPALGNPAADVLIEPTFGGFGGLAGYWIDGFGFLTLQNTNVELGRTV